MPDPLPGKGFLGWLGRQVGYVKKAVNDDVAAKKLYEQKRTEEQPHPEDPDVTLRRTTIDQAIKKLPHDNGS
jgi:hypothetical protein